MTHSNTLPAILRQAGLHDQAERVERDVEQRLRSIGSNRITVDDDGTVRAMTVAEWREWGADEQAL